MLQSIYAAQGKFDEAKALIDSMVVAYYPVWGTIIFLYSAAADVFLDDAQRFADSLGIDYSRIDFQEMWALTQWEGYRGRAGATPRHQGSARRAPLPPVTIRPHAQESLRKLMPVVEARLLLAQGDSSAAIDALRRLRPEASVNDIRNNAWEPLAAEQMLLARLLVARAQRTQDEAEAARDYRAAIDVALNLANGEPTAFMVFLRPSLEIVRLAAHWSWRCEPGVSSRGAARRAR